MRRLIGFSLLLLLSFWVYGCGGGSNTDPGQGSSTGVEDIRQAGGVSGFIARRSVNPRTAGSLVFSTAPDSGLVAVANSSVVVKNETESTTLTTDERGFIRVSGLPGGSYTMTVAGESFPITILFDAELSLSSPAISRDEAAARAKTALRTAGIDPETTQGLGPQSPLPAGVRIRPGLAPSEDITEISETVVVPELSWFFYFDPRPDARFSHGCQYILVNAQSGATQIFERANFPELNGTEFYASADANLGHPDLIQNATQVAAPIALRVRRADSAPEVLRQEASPGGKTHALLVRATTEPDFEVDVKNMESLLTDLGAEVTVLRLGEAGPNREQVDQDPKKLLSAAARTIYEKMEPCDTFFLYFSGHSTKQSAKDADKATFEVSLFGRKRYNDKGTIKFFEGENKNTSASWNNFALEECPACNIIVVADVCFSELYIRNNPKFNGTGRRPIKNLFAIVGQLQGRRGLLLSSADTKNVSLSLEPGFKASLPFSQGAGGFYTNVLIKGVRSAFSSNPNSDLFSLFTQGHNQTLELAQNPQLQRIDPSFEDNTICLNGDASPPPTPTPSPTPTSTPNPDPVQFSLDTDSGTTGGQSSVSFTHEIGMTACPQPVGSFTVQNLDTEQITVTPQANDEMDVIPAVGTIEAGQSRTFQVFYNCSETASFLSFLFIDVSSANRETASSVISYNATLTSPPCVTQAVFRNNTGFPVDIRFVSNNMQIGIDVLVPANPPNNEYIVTKDFPLDNLEIRYNSSTVPLGMPVPCGSRGVFTRGADFSTTPTVELIP